MKIGYLYYDLMNLYGDNGNVKALTNALDKMNIPYSLKLITKGDKFYFSDFDFIYIGSGTERNQTIALHDLIKYKDDIKKYIEDGKILLATGNSFEIFGKNFLNVVNFETEFNSERKSNECLFEFSELDKPLIGLENKIGMTKEANLFKVVRGNGNFEGFNYKNFYGTYLLGPILIRNPHFLKYIFKKLTKKDLEIDLSFEEKAYENYIINIDNVEKL